MTDCVGEAPESQELKRSEPLDKKRQGNVSGSLVFLTVSLASGGGTLYYSKFCKPKADVFGSIDLSEYYFDDEDKADDEEMGDD